MTLHPLSYHNIFITTMSSTSSASKHLSPPDLTAHVNMWSSTCENPTARQRAFVPLSRLPEAHGKFHHESPHRCSSITATTYLRNVLKPFCLMKPLSRMTFLTNTLGTERKLVWHEFLELLASQQHSALVVRTLSYRIRRIPVEEQPGLSFSSSTLVTFHQCLVNAKRSQQNQSFWHGRNETIGTRLNGAYSGHVKRNIGP